MAARQTPAEQLREHRIVFERALRDGLTLNEARIAIAKERWAASEARLRASQCGTRAPSAATDMVGDRPRWFTETEGDWA